MATLEIPDEDSDSECNAHDDATDDKDGKKATVTNKKPVKKVEKKITVGPFHMFKLRGIYRKEISVTEWRNKHSDLKVDDLSEDQDG